MSARTEIRPACPGDLPALAGLVRQLFTLEPDFTFDETRVRQGLIMLLDSELAIVLVAEEGSRVVGMCTGQQVISTAEGGPAVLVEDLIVLPGWRGRGVARALLEELGRWTADQGAERMQLLADRDNEDALAFYRRTGWRITRLVCLRNRVASMGQGGSTEQRKGA